MAAIIRWARAIAACGLCAWLCAGARAAAPPSGSGSVVNSPPAGPQPGPRSRPGNGPLHGSMPLRAEGADVGILRHAVAGMAGRSTARQELSRQHQQGSAADAARPRADSRAQHVDRAGRGAGRYAGRKGVPSRDGLPKIDSRLPGGGLEEPSEQPKTTVRSRASQERCRGFPAYRRPSPARRRRRRSSRRPRRKTTRRDRTSGRAACRPSIRCTEDIAPERRRPRPGRLERVLEPGFRGDVDRPRLTQSQSPPARRPAEAEPVRQAAIRRLTRRAARPCSVRSSNGWPDSPVAWPRLRGSPKNRRQCSTVTAR